MRKTVKRLLAFLICVSILGMIGQGRKTIYAQEFAESLYAQSAVLMDGDSGRVLYGKDAYKQMPMASTTKVMTCIVTLENASEDEVVEVSDNAAAQPDVQLHIQTGERYYLKDLLYSLMLKSHNESAVAIAEHVGGSVEGFAKLMNQKAMELGCKDTHFVTPNGLDAQDEGGAHSTTARDLATIMRYAIKNSRFLAITQTPDYSFSDLEEKRIFVLHNTNALLGNMEGLLSGKTGFTGNAGYCYVCAVKRDERTFVIALLACGWPNNKTYKWADTKKLVDYAFEEYHYRDIWQEKSFGAIPVSDGIPLSDNLYDTAYTNVKVLGAQEQKKKLLMREDENIEVKESLLQRLKAPVHEGDVAGNVAYTLEGEEICNYPIILQNTIEKRNYIWCMQKLLEKFLL